MLKTYSSGLSPSGPLFIFSKDSDSPFNSDSALLNTAWNVWNLQFWKDQCHSLGLQRTRAKCCKPVACTFFQNSPSLSSFWWNVFGHSIVAALGLTCLRLQLTLRWFAGSATVGWFEKDLWYLSAMEAWPLAPRALQLKGKQLGFLIPVVREPSGSGGRPAGRILGPRWQLSWQVTSWLPPSCFWSYFYFTLYWLWASGFVQIYVVTLVGLSTSVGWVPISLGSTCWTPPTKTKLEFQFELLSISSVGQCCKFVIKNNKIR